MKFETIYVLEPSRVQEDYEKFNKDLKIFINQNGAVISAEIWGERLLAYPIKKHNKGCYGQAIFETENEDFTSKLNEFYDTNEIVIKHIIVKIG